MSVTLQNIVFKGPVAIGLLTGVCASVPAFAQQASLDAPAPGMEFELGAGGYIAPRFEGSSHYSVSAYPVIRFGYIALDNGFLLGGGDGQGLSVRPSFRYVGARKARDFPELSGLRDIDAAAELGLGAKYATGPVSVFGDLRYGVTGHNGVVGEVGADYVMRPTGEVTVAIGPRASFASADYMDTYFGVSSAEAASFGSSAFNAKGGFKSYGAEIGTRYQFNESWALESGAAYNRLIDDAAESPITAKGSSDQYTFKLGLVRNFRIDF